MMFCLRLTQTAKSHFIGWYFLIRRTFYNTIKMQSESCLIYLLLYFLYIFFKYNKPIGVSVFQPTCQLNSHISSTIATSIQARVLRNPCDTTEHSGNELKYTSGDPQGQTHTGKSKTMETYPHGAIERHGNKSMWYHTDSSQVWKFASRQGEIPPGSFLLSRKLEKNTIHFITNYTHPFLWFLQRQRGCTDATLGIAYQQDMNSV